MTAVKRKRESSPDASISKYFNKSGPAASSPAKNRKTSPSPSSLADLRAEWRELYAKTLPAAAKARSPGQPKWPVALDHCFARIILDNAVGETRQWTEVVKAPAVKNMSEEQLRAALKLGGEILSGEADLVQLDERSLALRNQESKVERGAKAGKKEAKREDPAAAVPRSPSKPADPIDVDAIDTAAKANPDEVDYISVIAASPDLKPFRKSVLMLICQIPRGRFSTYKHMSAHLASSPRAVGNALRNNPYAPGVPCHRVLAADGSIGGFGGDWGENGKHVAEKKRLLREEGVRFDVNGKAVGRPFDGFAGKVAG